MPVVVEENDDGVFQFSGCFQLLQQGADRIVNPEYGLTPLCAVFTGSPGDGPGVRLDFRGVVQPSLGGCSPVRFPGPFRRCRPMGNGGCKVQEKRAAVVLFQELQGAFCTQSWLCTAKVLLPVKSGLL